MATIPASTKASLNQRINTRAHDRWPQIKAISTTYRGAHAYIGADLIDGEHLPLCRLKYVGYASQWGFAIYRASHDDYQRALLPGGWHAGSPEDALDTACGLYLADPTAWT